MQQTRPDSAAGERAFQYACNLLFVFLQVKVLESNWHWFSIHLRSMCIHTQISHSQSRYWSLAVRTRLFTHRPIQVTAQGQRQGTCSKTAPMLAPVDALVQLSMRIMRAVMTPMLTCASSVIVSIYIASELLMVDHQDVADTSVAEAMRMALKKSSSEILHRRTALIHTQRQRHQCAPISTVRAVSSSQILECNSGEADTSWQVTGRARTRRCHTMARPLLTAPQPRCTWSCPPGPAKPACT